MKEKDNLTEREESRSTELSPTPGVIDTLRGTISEPRSTISHKPGAENGQLVAVRIAKDGSGMFGLTDRKDNKVWSGIFNHSLLSARYSIHFAEIMKQAGYDTNPQRIIDGMIVSHAGRRAWEEANFYPDAFKEGEEQNHAEERRNISNERLGLRFIKGKVPEEAFELVAALAHDNEGFPVHPEVYDGWNYRITSYVDHRTTDRYQPLHTRMAGFLIGNFFDKGTDTSEVADTIREIIDRRKGAYSGHEGKDISLEEADEIAKNLGANKTSARLSNRKDLMNMILEDAETEATLQHAGIDTENINATNVPMPKWEDELRRDYVKAAEEEAFSRLYMLYNTGGVKAKQIEEEFPSDNWWGKYIREIYNEQDSQTSNSELQKSKERKGATEIFRS